MFTRKDFKSITQQLLRNGCLKIERPNYEVKKLPSSELSECTQNWILDMIISYLHKEPPRFQNGLLVEKSLVHFALGLLVKESLLCP